MRFQDLYIGANRLLGRFIYFLGFKGLFQPQREVHTVFLPLISNFYTYKINRMLSVHRQTFMQNLS